MAKEKMYQLAEQQNDDLFENFDALAKYIQQECRAPIQYKVDEVLSPPPHPFVRIEIRFPNGSIHYSRGKNKKEAANAYAQQFRPSDIDSYL